MVLLYSCKEVPLSPNVKYCDTLEYDKKVVTKLQYRNRLVLTDEAHKNGYVEKPVVYNNSVLGMKTRNQTLYLSMNDAFTGETIWEKPRKLRMNGDYFDYTLNNTYQKDNNLIQPIFGNDYAGVANIDLETGNYLWEHEDFRPKIWIDYNAVITGIDSLFFFYGKPREEVAITGRYANTIYCGSVETGICRKLCVPPFEKEQESDSVVVELIIPVKIQDTTYLLIGYNSHQKAYIGLYNKNTDSWKYANIPIPGVGFIPTYEVDDNKFYINSVYGGMICGNILTGEIVWNDSKHYLSYNGIFINNLIIGSDEDENSIENIHAHDKISGEIIWVNSEIKAWKYMSELNGILYFNNGNLYAVDGKTGTLLWRLEPNDGGRFSECAVVPGVNGRRGRVIGRSEIYSYGYDAIK